MSEEKSRSAQEIEVDLARTRLELTRTVNELSDRLDPRRQVDAVKAEAKATAADIGERAKAFVEDVKKGDRKSLAIAGAGLAAAVLAITVKVRRS